MKGYRKLKPLEYIKRGDMWKCGNVSGPVDCCIGTQVYADSSMDFYSPLPKKKKVQRRIDLRMKIVRIAEDCILRGVEIKHSPYAIGCMIANEITPYIQGAYRRRVRK